MAKPAPWFKDNDPHLTAADRHDWIAVLPLGAHEQHGPHLPFETDTIIATGIAERVAAALPDHLPVTFLTVEPVGYSIEHMDVGGTRTLAFDEAVNRWLAIARDLHHQGIRKLVLLNAQFSTSLLITLFAVLLLVDGLMGIYLAVKYR